MIRKMIYTVLVISGIIISLCLAFFIYLQVNEYSPAMTEILKSVGRGKILLPKKREFTVLSWNIGYAGLGCETDFFYDGGKSVYPEKKQMNLYLEGISRKLKDSDTLDFIFLQEIDRNSRRTYHKDQLNYLLEFLSDYSAVFAYNYRVGFVPVPVVHPMGKVEAGLGIFSKYIPETSCRYALNAFFPWPTRLVMLKRCFILNSYPAENGKKLIMIIIHNSAYDTAGKIRQEELGSLQDFMLEEYRKGNYIVCGGDWNNNPRGFNPSTIKTGDKVFGITPAIDSTFLSGWEMVYDPEIPTNRNTNSPYEHGRTGTTIIDFFLISPNVENIGCRTQDLAFKYSDHNPVYARFRLKDK